MSESAETLDATRATAALAKVLKSQYHAALAMLRDAIEQCPDDLGLDERPQNAFWQVAYHTLFFAHLYVGQEQSSFMPPPASHRIAGGSDPRRAGHRRQVGREDPVERIVIQPE